MIILQKILPRIALLILAGSAAAAEPDLGKRIAQQDGWVAYQVPKTADGGIACCFQMHGKHAVQSGCDLEGSNWGNSDDQRPPQATAEALNVYFRVSHGKIDKVRAFSASCPVRDADKVRWLDNVAPQASVAYLAASTAATPSEDIFDAELAALARHAIAAGSGREASRDVREQAVFALSQLKGGGADAALSGVVRGSDPRDVK